MVGGPELSILMVGAIGALVGFLVGREYFLLAGFVGSLVGAVLGGLLGACGWGFCDHCGAKCRQAIDARHPFAAVGWFVAGLVGLLLCFSSPLWLLYLLARS
ncbi:hypothetical protein [Anatilimnocola floriformis]|uniref:hypothetical protein n=1 Tax=Anatilimnocola floriformis TaxID=2948575 RepID=UPI0020C4BE24|nr:hypothetical protein [Anatilimnocola floriformis]